MKYIHSHGRNYHPTQRRPFVQRMQRTQLVDATLRMLLALKTESRLLALSTLKPDAKESKEAKQRVDRIEKAERAERKLRHERNDQCFAGAGGGVTAVVTGTRTSARRSPRDVDTCCFVPTKKSGTQISSIRGSFERRTRLLGWRGEGALRLNDNRRALRP